MKFWIATILLVFVLIMREARLRLQDRRRRRNYEDYKANRSKIKIEE